jgi:hypothetical protein
MTSVPHLYTFLVWFLDTLAVRSIQIILIHCEPETSYDTGMGYFIQNPWEFMFSGYRVSL